MRSSSARRVFDYARTGTFTIIERARTANRKMLYLPLGAAATAVAAGAGLWVRSCLLEHQRISNMVDPTASCDNYRPDHILDTMKVTDRRREPIGFTVEDVQNILASVDFRFTSGLSEARIVGDLRSSKTGQSVLVSGRYFEEDQSFEISNNVVGFYYYKLVEAVFHEMGHHVEWKLMAKGHDPERVIGKNKDRFAQIFAYALLSPAVLDWSRVNPYGLEPPKPEELEWMRKNVFCDRALDNWYLHNPNAMSVFAKLFIEFQQYDKLAEVLSKLSELPIDPMATPDIRSYLALIRNEFFQVDPLHLIEDLSKIKGALDKLQITPDLLLRVAEYFRGFGNTEFAEALTSFTTTLR